MMTDAVRQYRQWCEAEYEKHAAVTQRKADAAIAELEKEVERLTATVDILTRSLNSHVGSASAKKCPVCNGSGGWYDYSRASTAVHGNYQNCHGCGGKGWVTT
jgi:hypothetical protein